MGVKSLHSTRVGLIVAILIVCKNYLWRVLMRGVKIIFDSNRTLDILFDVCIIRYGN
ncbi:MAG: hypothetical protein ABIL07_01220 [candidate division WOR-3 bacterium]